jgi:ABC-type phosphate/phosphonate transport system ATPase subunit
VIATLHHVEYARRYADRVLGLRAGELVFDVLPPALTDATLQSLFGAAPLQSEPPALTTTRETAWVASS